MWLLVCNRFVSVLQQDKADLNRPKRKYEKKPKVLPPSATAPQPSPAALPVFSAKDLNQYDFPSSDEEPLSQVNRRAAPCIQKRSLEAHVFDLSLLYFKVLSGSSEAEEDNDPDGPFAFRRKAGCQYYAVSVRLFL